MALIVGGLVAVAMIGVALYGAANLPSGAQVPLHFGLASYNSWVPKPVGLVLWPLIGVVVYVVLISTHGSRGGTRAIVITVVMVVMLVTEVGALRAAVNRNRSG